MNTCSQCEYCFRSKCGEQDVYRCRLMPFRTSKKKSSNLHRVLGGREACRKFVFRKVKGQLEIEYDE